MKEYKKKKKKKNKKWTSSGNEQELRTKGKFILFLFESWLFFLLSIPITRSRTISEQCYILASGPTFTELLLHFDRGIWVATQHYIISNKGMWCKQGTTRPCIAYLRSKQNKVIELKKEINYFIFQFQDLFIHKLHFQLFTRHNKLNWQLFKRRQ
jgi:hypothetical protein